MSARNAAFFEDTRRTQHFECRRGFYESESHATLTIFAKGVPDEGHVRTAINPKGTVLEANIKVPGRGVCQFKVSLPAAITTASTVLSASRLKVEFKLLKKRLEIWGTVGILTMVESTELPSLTSAASAAATTANVAADASPIRTPGKALLTAIPLVGLKNLGNSCFANSVLQLLNSVGQLVIYFRSDIYRRDINKTNFLGSQGQLAETYADLVVHMSEQEHLRGCPRSASPTERTDRASSVAPRMLQRLLKTFITSRADSVGGTQSDAMEFLIYVLDGLHEDLQRVREKPKYSEGSDSEDEAEASSEMRLAKMNRKLASWRSWSSASHARGVCPLHNVMAAICPDYTRPSRTAEN